MLVLVEPLVLLLVPPLLVALMTCLALPKPSPSLVPPSLGPRPPIRTGCRAERKWRRPSPSPPPPRPPPSEKSVSPRGSSKTAKSSVVLVTRRG